MANIALPEFGAQLTKRARLYKFNELHSAPFPKAGTTEEILRIAAEVEARGYKVVVRAQRPVRLRAPKQGEAGIIVAETVDQAPGYKPTVYCYDQATAATGEISSSLWFCGPDYPFFGSYRALQGAWRERKDQLRLEELARAGLLEE